MQLLLFGAMIALLSVAILRQGAHGGVYTGRIAALQATTWLVLVSTVWLALFRVQEDRKRSQYILAHLFAPVVYIATNVILEAVGVTPTQAGNSPNQAAGLLSVLGVGTGRVTFPREQPQQLRGHHRRGIRPPVSCLARSDVKWVKRAAWIGVLVSIYALLRVDTRAAMIFPLVALVLVVYAPLGGSARRWLPASLVIPIGPLLVLGLGSVLANTALGPRLSRVEAEALLPLQTGTPSGHRCSSSST